MRRRVFRGVAVVLGSALLLAAVFIAVAFMTGLSVMNGSLDAQKQHLSSLRDEVAEQPEGVYEDWQEQPIADAVPWDRVQTIATHNSYATAPSGLQRAILGIVRPGVAGTLDYGHPTLWRQFESGVRGIELDLRVHGDGALRLTHVPMLANGSNAPDFRLALEEIALWSASHPGHLPITVLIEFKSDYAFLDPSLADWDADALADVDDVLEERLGASLLRPGDLEGPAWPATGALRDRVLVIMHPDAAVEASYAELPADEHAMFAAFAGEDRAGASAAIDAAEQRPVFAVHNTPDAAAIAPLVEAGAVVRTRADADLDTGAATRDRALGSGAQILSTDFASPETQPDTGYTVQFEDGALVRVDPARQPTPEELRRAAAEAWVDAASTRQLVGSVIMASVPSADPALLHRMMQESGLGGFILMGANVPGTPDALRQLTAALAVDPAMPPLVGIDEEGGEVTRLPWDSFAGADSLRYAPAAETTTAFAGRAGLLVEAGVNVNFGIVADCTPDPESFIHWRTLGDDAGAAAERVAAAVEGEHGRVASTLKHFPGHGVARGDSHHSVPQTDLGIDAWRADVAAPFRAGVDAGAELLMFGHLSYTSVDPAPASLSPEWYRVAREELGFEGVAITDDLAMLQASGIAEYQDPAANAVAALSAGADLALIVGGMDYPGAIDLVDRVTAAAESGALPAQRLREAAIRVAELRLLLAERAVG